MRRVRCPFCNRLVGFAGEKSDLHTHIVKRHFPMHCTVCNMIAETHELSQTSPQHLIACPHGTFITGDPRP